MNVKKDDNILTYGNYANASVTQPQNNLRTWIGIWYYEAYKITCLQNFSQIGSEVLACFYYTTAHTCNKTRKDNGRLYTESW